MNIMGIGLSGTQSEYNKNWHVKYQLFDRLALHEKKLVFSKTHVFENCWKKTRVFFCNLHETEKNSSFHFSTYTKNSRKCYWWLTCTVLTLKVSYKLVERIYWVKCQAAFICQRNNRWKANSIWYNKEKNYFKNSIFLA